MLNTISVSNALVCRFLLALRAVYYNESVGGYASAVSSVHFTALVGNIGAPLDSDPDGLEFDSDPDSESSRGSNSIPSIDLEDHASLDASTTYQSA